MTLMEKYIIARWCYAVGEDYISDMEYRGIEDKLKEENPDNEYINRSWSDDPCPVELLRKYNMEHLIKNVEFIHKSESIRSLYNEEDYRNNINTKFLVERRNMNIKQYDLEFSKNTGQLL